ncbi:hypothetical protein VNO78_05374 [Psophocarpus tetragonolobus]|uniref:CASP-like protein n=1 Tax=Psophocarpus tetragonolobus TaxID=3891 RepID=A0AAN9STR3_PSOTE
MPSILRVRFLLVALGTCKLHHITFQLKWDRYWFDKWRIRVPSLESTGTQFAENITCKEEYPEIELVQLLNINILRSKLMDELPGSAGTSAGFTLRLGQTFFSSASLLFMSLGVEFYSYTAFCYLVTIMGLVIPWSFTLALVDGYSVMVKCPIRQPGILLIIVVGDWVLSTLTLAAACSTASVVDLLLNTHGSFCPPMLCSRYRISAIMAFLSWFLSLTSSLFNLWLLPSL